MGKETALQSDSVVMGVAMQLSLRCMQLEKYQQSLAEHQLELEHSTKVGASSMAKFKRAVASARALAARNSKSSVVAPELPPILVAKEVDAAPEVSKSSSDGGAHRPTAVSTEAPIDIWEHGRGRCGRCSGHRRSVR